MHLAQIKIDTLNIRIYGSRSEMGEAAAKDAAACIQQVIAEKGEANIIFAAAPSQNEFLQSLFQKPIDWARVNALHMDEYIGLSPDAPQGFGNFLRRTLFDHVPLKSISYIAFPGLSAQEMTSRYTRILAIYPPDIVCMGIGENGHIAFNDPGEADFADPVPVKVVNLDTACRQQQVNDGCFSSFCEVPKQAITLTIPTLVQVPHVLCIVPGAAKANALRDAAYGPITEACPASILRRKKDAMLYTETEGGKYLSEMFQR